MNVVQLKKFCMQFPGAQEVLHDAPVNVLTYRVGGKNFAYFKTSAPEQWRFSVRVMPEQFLALTDPMQTHGNVKPARYMARHHWLTVVHVQQFPADYLRELVTASYQRAVASLSLRKQQALVTP